MPHAHKTFLELLLKFYNVGLSKGSNSKSDIYLVKLFRKFHYRYHEEMNFDGGDVREDILWTLVANENGLMT